MDENRQNSTLQQRIHELSRSLEYAKLKITDLETIIKVVEEDLKIKIVKSLVPNCQKIKTIHPTTLCEIFMHCLV